MSFDEARILAPKDQQKGLSSAELNTTVFVDYRADGSSLGVEQEFSINSVWTGFIDLLRVGPDGSVTIRDHKFTSSKRYIPSVEELASDPQLILYARVGFLLFQVDTITCVFDYYGTRTLFWEPREIHLTREQNCLDWTAMRAEGLSVLSNYDRAEVKEAAPNYLECRDFGGCEYQQVCGGELG